MQYKINVNDTFSFDLNEENTNQLDAVETQNNRYHILHGHQSYSAEIISDNFSERQYSVKVNNSTYTVTIENPLDLLIKQMGFEKNAGQLINSLKAPMPGLILSISVAPGQTVAKNDPLLILSAMKMENSFLSPRDGVIKSVHAKIGDAVDKGQLLIEFE